jgi:hypothetical protein
MVQNSNHFIENLITIGKLGLNQFGIIVLNFGLINALK